MKLEGNVTEIFNGVGFAIAICGLCLGVGSCNYLEHKGIAKVIEAKGQARLMEAQAKQIEASIKNPEKEVEEATR